MTEITFYIAMALLSGWICSDRFGEFFFSLETHEFPTAAFLFFLGINSHMVIEFSQLYFLALKF
jgi:hypothetical protein